MKHLFVVFVILITGLATQAQKPLLDIFFDVDAGGDTTYGYYTLYEYDSEGRLTHLHRFDSEGRPRPSLRYSYQGCSKTCYLQTNDFDWEMYEVIEYRDSLFLDDDEHISTANWKMVQTFDHESLLWTTHYAYDSLDRLVRFYSINEKGDTISLTTIAYTSFRSVTTEWESGKIIYEWTTVYLDNMCRYPIEETRTSPESKPVRKYYTYDDDMRIKIHKHYVGDYLQNDKSYEYHEGYRVLRNGPGVNILTICSPALIPKLPHLQK